MDRVYDTLIPPYRHIVDRLVAETAGEGWAVRRAYLTSVFAALHRGQAKHPDAIHPEETLAHIIAAMIETLGTPPVEERLQAGIYAASARRDHRDIATTWFDAHPEEFQAIRDHIAAIAAGARPGLH